MQAQDSLDDMVLYLCSDRSRYVTGATFTIDDGQSL
jgi:NAD(P)-dependent dehydrogenase (short-subunit alcohol dehydrogenase family)